MNDQALPAGSAARILVVEDLPAQAELARLFLAGLGYDVQIEGTAGAALTTAREWQPDGLLLDIELPDYNGLELLGRLKEEGSDAVVVVVTASASMELAKQAIRAGAEDFVVKPYNKERLSVTLRNALQRRALTRTREALETQLNRAETRLQDAEAKLGRKGFAGFIGASDQMRAVYDIIQSVARSKASVFITGESGTGKELAAEALHKSSQRAGGSFIALNCGAIPRDLLESEVFGHVKGAFTGATADRPGAASLADGGTLFLDEIGEMPLEMQVKLLRFVQTGTFSPVGSSKVTKVDVRFVCATNRDPMLEVQAGRFREDLYYRLYVVPVELPPLRDRGDDVLLIARHFLTQFAREEHRRFRGFSPAAEATLTAYPWPGNVRQLQNVVRNIVVLHDADLVGAEMIPPPVNRPYAHDPRPAPPAVPEPARAAAAAAEDPPEMPVPMAAALAEPAGVPAGMSRPMAPEIEIMPLAEMERRLVLAALARTDGDIPRAAALLEINPSTVYRKVSAWRKDGLMPA
nr:sigma-54 dependent transcriptional regulator [uncultured Rhodopila sp.]